MFPIAPDETLVETKICKHCAISFPITDKDIEFYEKVSPKFPSPSGEGLGVRTYLIPTPKLCPDCRQQRRLSFRNERKLYKRKCNATGENIISIYSPNKPYIVYNQDFWWSDKWNPMDYGREFDFSRGFFEQFGELMRRVPKASLSNEQQENSEYSNYSWWNKNCYLIFLGAHNENVYHSSGVWSSEDTIDCSYSTELHDSCWLINSIHCYSCYFSEILENCTNCIFCFNIKGKSYHIFNTEVTPEEYHSYKKKLQNYWFLQSEFQKFLSLKSSNIHPENFNLHSEKIQGEYLLWSKNIQQSFDIVECQDCKYVTWLFRSSNCYDIYDWGDTAKWCYECHKVGESVSYSCFCASCLHGVDQLFYCFDCVNTSSHLFWCVGLRNASYCILNRQYTKEEYETLVPKIIEHMMTTGEWGEFFPSSLSPFGYNETVAQEYFPMSREEVLNGHPELVSGSASVLGQKEDPEISSAWREVSLRGVEWNETTKQSSVPMVSVSRTSGTSGSPHFVRDDDTKEDSDTFLHWPIFNWSDYESPFPKVDKIIPARKLPEDISSIPDDILNWAIECEVTGKPFRIIPQELEFYRKHHLPIPRRHPDQRHLDRMKMRNPRKLFERKCDQCGKDMITTYSPDRKELVFCENCYNTTVLS